MAIFVAIFIAWSGNIRVLLETRCFAIINCEAGLSRLLLLSFFPFFFLSFFFFFFLTRNEFATEINGIAIRYVTVTIHLEQFLEIEFFKQA